MCKIRFESENYYFYLNYLIIRETYKTNSGLQEMINALNSFFSFKIVKITDPVINKPDIILYYQPQITLPADSDDNMYEFTLKRYYSLKAV